MHRRILIGALTLLALTGWAIANPPLAGATEIWSGRTFFFSKAAFANPALASSQDRITPLVFITRGSTKGIYNIAQESAFSATSPIGTEWATGDAVNYHNLIFDTWETWNLRNPPSMVGVNAVVHLIAEDFYIDIVFNSWGEGPSGGGAFSYLRGVRPLATPTRGTTWGRIKNLFR